jgi:hypothetical protein
MKESLANRVDWDEEERLATVVNPVFIADVGKNLEGRMVLCAALVEAAREE